MFTKNEIIEAVEQQEKLRDNLLAQANFHAGYIACLNEIKAQMELDEQPAETSEVGEAVEVKEEKIKHGNKKAWLN